MLCSQYLKKHIRLRRETSLCHSSVSLVSPSLQHSSQHGPMNAIHTLSSSRLKQISKQWSHLLQTRWWCQSTQCRDKIMKEYSLLGFLKLPEHLWTRLHHGGAYFWHSSEGTESLEKTSFIDTNPYLVQTVVSSHELLQRRTDCHWQSENSTYQVWIV